MNRTVFREIELRLLDLASLLRDRRRKLPWHALLEHIGITLAVAHVMDTLDNFRRYYGPDSEDACDYHEEYLGTRDQLILIETHVPTSHAFQGQ